MKEMTNEVPQNEQSLVCLNQGINEQLLSDMSEIVEPKREETRWRMTEYELPDHTQYSQIIGHTTFYHEHTLTNRYDRLYYDPKLEAWRNIYGDRYKTEVLKHTYWYWTLKMGLNPVEIQKYYENWIKIDN